MGKVRTAWHLLAATFMDERRPACVRLETEVSLSTQPQRADLILVRKREGGVDDAKAFFGLWRRMSRVALVEYKSRSRPPRLGTFHQLLGYGHQYARRWQPDVPASELSLFLMVPELTSTLEKDLGLMGLELGTTDAAYMPVKHAVFPTWIVALNALADEEAEPLIGQLGSRTLSDKERASLRWLAHFVMEKKESLRLMEDFEELRDQFMRSDVFKEMLNGMSVDEVAEALTSEQRYARYDVLLTMSDEALRNLPDAFVDALPESVRAEIRRRIAH